MLGACAQGLQYFVCYKSPVCFFLLTKILLYVYLATSFSLVFLGFQLTDFDKTVSFGRYSVFHGYFVVFTPDKRFRILLVAIAVTWNVLYNALPLLIFYLTYTL